jgi:malate dehydrogenase (oxaloacetate-decarboxylating)
MHEPEQPYCDYRMTVRVEIPNRPGMFAQIANAIAQEGASLGAIDIVEANRQRMVRDITFDAQSEAHAQRVLERLRTLPHLKIRSASDRIFLLHLGGKISTRSKVPIRTRNTLSMTYTPGVARVARAIAQDRDKVFAFTSKANSVAVVTDGSAVLGLGNLGPEAALPVMEGKVMLFKEFADIDGWPLCLATQEVDEIVRFVQAVAPTFGGINLEDISAPRCFEIEERLQESLDIPVMHDDQHGTAVVILAALLNALKVVGKRLDEIKVVINGLGAAGTAAGRILLAAGVRHLIGCDRAGAVLHVTPDNAAQVRANFRGAITWDRPFATLPQALAGADVFIGLSVGNVLQVADLERMAPQRIVFAMANPEPEIAPDLALPHCRILATGRSDYPNQVNNLLAFPGIFRGALDVRASCINEAMKLAAAQAIAHIIPEDHLSEDYIVPSVFDRRVVRAVAQAVAQAARQTGVARKQSERTNI